MAKQSLYDLIFPVGGLDKRYSVQKQRPYTSPDCLNVRPIDSIQGRERGGSRPGLGKAFYEQLGSGNPVRLLSSVSYVQTDGWQYWSDSFSGSTIGTNWSTATWGGMVAPSLLTDGASLSYGTSPAGLVRSEFTTWDTSQAYEIAIYLSPWQAAYWGQFQIFAKMNNASPVATTDGVVAEIVLGAAGAYSGTLKSYNASTVTSYSLTSGTPGAAMAGWLRMLVTGSNIKVYWQGALLIDQTVALGGSAGSRFGFGMNCTDAGGVCLVDRFRLQYKTATKAQSIRRPLVASANGSLYVESMYGSMTSVSSNYALASDRQLQAAEWGQKLYIADYSDPVALGSDGVRGTGDTKLDAASYSDWTAVAGLNAYDYVAVISSPTGGGVAGTYWITGVSSGELTLDTAWCTTAGDTCTYRIERGPKIYDPAANTLSPWKATTGQVPTGNPCIARFLDSIVLAGGAVAPHVWYKGKSGDPLNWDYSVTNAGAAAAGTSSTAGTIGEPIIAIAVPSDDYCLFGCQSTMWIMRGDPTDGGRIDCISRTAGIVDRQAHCFGPAGEFTFLSRDGIYIIMPGEQAFPQSLSREKLPQELRDVDRNIYTVTMRYDVRDRGVHVFRTPVDTQSVTHYWLDWSSKGFWPVQIPGTSEPTSMCEYASSNSEDSAVILGGKDGYLRKFAATNDSDEGTSITNYVVYGPIKSSGSDYYNGRITEIIATLSQNSGNVTWNIRTGTTPEEALVSSDSTYAMWTGTWVAGTNYKNRPRKDGVVFLLKLSGSGTRKWAIERITVETTGMGRQRLL